MERSSKGDGVKRHRRIDRYMRRYRPKLIPGRYRCYRCKGVFNKGWSDEDAAKEAGINFPGYEPCEDDLVCDPCFNKINVLLWQKGVDNTERGTIIHARSCSQLCTTLPYTHSTTA